MFTLQDSQFIAPQSCIFKTIRLHSDKEARHTHKKINWIL